MADGSGVGLKWLGAVPDAPVGVTFGVPWERGALKRDEPLALVDDACRPVPVQTWHTAFWPDGSVKWSAHAAVFQSPSPGGYYVVRSGVARTSLEERASGGPAAPGGKCAAEQRPGSAAPHVEVQETGAAIEVATGTLFCRIPKEGAAFMEELRLEGAAVAREGRLVAVREARTGRRGSRTTVEESFESRIARAVVEQAGPVRAVVRIEGFHRAISQGAAGSGEASAPAAGTGEANNPGSQPAGVREWLPFVLRLYFYAGLASVRIVHTFTYDGDNRADFIKGLGLSFKVPLSGALCDRHVRFAGETGLFREPVRLLPPAAMWRHRDRYARQIAGEPVELGDDPRLAELVEDMSAWDAFKLVQDSADHYSIQKRAGEEYCWLEAAHGRRAKGLAFVGGPGGGLAAGIRWFWEKHPASIEIEGLTTPEATLLLWLWSPDAPAMELTPYDAPGKGGRSSYGSLDPVTGTPYGIANTSELSLWAFTSVPSTSELLACAEALRSPALLVCEPRRYHATRVFGVWSREDRSTPARAWVEDQLDALFAFYRDEVESRRWYGFWHYGDFMHTYDPVRHSWRYDVGGYAWQNTELVPTYWLWYMFLRSGREDVFRLAEAMTRHTSEVDVYHLGPCAGLGTRHNVLHWGCGAKEARVSMAGHHRFFYYLTADERVGDVLREVRDADHATAREVRTPEGESRRLDPMRSYFPKDAFPTHARSGPDWAAFCSNWLTEWERFEDPAYLRKLLQGIASLKRMPHRLVSGSTFGYDPATCALHYIGDGNYQYHMVVAFGAPQVWMEIAELIRDPEWEAMLAEFGEFYLLDKEEKARRTSEEVVKGTWDWPMLASAMAAYAAAKKGDRALARQVWGLLFDADRRRSRFVGLPIEREAVAAGETVRPMWEIPGITTNAASQWCLNVIVCLELIGDSLDECLGPLVSSGSGQGR